MIHCWVFQRQHRYVLSFVLRVVSPFKGHCSFSISKVAVLKTHYCFFPSLYLQTQLLLFLCTAFAYPSPSSPASRQGYQNNFINEQFRFLTASQHTLRNICNIITYHGDLKIKVYTKIIIFIACPLHSSESVPSTWKKWYEIPRKINNILWAIINQKYFQNCFDQHINTVPSVLPSALTHSLWSSAQHTENYATEQHVQKRTHYFLLGVCIKSENHCLCFVDFQWINQLCLCCKFSQMPETVARGNTSLFCD